MIDRPSLDRKPPSSAGVFREYRRIFTLAAVVGCDVLPDRQSPVGKWKTVDDKSGKVYRAEIWVDGTVKVRGYVSFLYKTQAWVKGP